MQEAPSESEHRVMSKVSSVAECKQCDSTRPICGRCSTANRSCSWESDGDTGLPFRNENAFAQGKARRPREKPGDRRQRNALALANPLSASLSVSIELQAFNYFQKNFSAWPVEMPDIGCDYLTYALGNWNRAGPGSSLQLAVSAFSHAVFFRQMRVSKAAEDADRFYARSIIQTQKEIKELSNERIDHLVVATLLMTNYEVNRSYFRRLSCMTNSLIELYVWSQEKICSKSVFFYTRRRWLSILEECLPLYRSCGSVADPTAARLSTEPASLQSRSTATGKLIR